MSNELTSPNSNPAFAATRQDLTNLKATAIDAAKDLSSTAAVHAEKAKGQLKELAGHARQETGEHVDQVKVHLDDVANTVRGYIAERPLAAVGIALGVGFLIGLTRSGCSKSA